MLNLEIEEISKNLEPKDKAFFNQTYSKIMDRIKNGKDASDVVEGIKNYAKNKGIKL